MRMGKIIQAQKTTTKGSEVVLSDEYIRELKMLFIDTANEIVPDFKFDDNNREIILNLFFYFTGQSGKYNLSKGLWLKGSNGTGKTSLLNIFSVFCRKRYRGFKVHDCGKVSNDYALNGDMDLYTYNQSGYSRQPVDMGFDELGRETIPANHFGQKLNVMQHILHIRYNLWKSVGIKTYITTNCDTDEIHALYDNNNDRFITDRCREMFNEIHLSGDSRRK